MAELCIGFSKVFGCDVIGMKDDADSKVLRNCFLVQFDETGKALISFMPRPLPVMFSVLGIRDELDVPISDLYWMAPVGHYSNSVNTQLSNLYLETSSIKTEKIFNERMTRGQKKQG